MNGNGLGRVAALVLVAALTLSSRLGAAASGQGSLSIREFFQGLVEHYGTSPMPRSEDVGRLGDRIDTARREEISDALPSIFVALGHKDATVRAIAALALVAISVRPDRADLLTKYFRRISDLLTSPDQRLPGFAVTILASLRPQAPPEVVPLLLAYLKRTDLDPKSQLGALDYLLRGTSNGLGAATAEEFLARPLDKQSRIAALNALANSRSLDSRIIDLEIKSLGDADFDVRWTAFQCLTRMGPAAIQRARPAMQNIVDESVTLLRRKDGDLGKQESTIFTLLQYSPDDQRVVDAVQEFFSLPLPPGVRTMALNQLRSPNTKDTRLIDLVGASLRDPSPDVRSTAAYVLKDMGPRALVRAEPTLIGLAQDPDQPAEVKEAAKRALMEIGKMR